MVRSLEDAHKPERVAGANVCYALIPVRDIRAAKGCFVLVSWIRSEVGLVSSWFSFPLLSLYIKKKNESKMPRPAAETRDGAGCSVCDQVLPGKERGQVFMRNSVSFMERASLPKGNGLIKGLSAMDNLSGFMLMTEKSNLWPVTGKFRGM